ncbi:MAG: 2'-deoxycytidine 5'-triphosphate deaminase [Planctomycetes bacterium]|nr:2'-deoxycytidine 5'-triphosphate deaminase [Planctomycetota bacterium]
MSAGVLNQEQILEMIKEVPSQIKWAQSTVSTWDQIDASAIDLPLGKTYWKMDASLRARQDGDVSDLILKHGGKEFTLTGDTVLERGQTYLFKLPWTLDLHEHICARATAKSSVGRLDALVRLVADKEKEFETVGMKKTCNIYLQVLPNTFKLIVRPGMVLSQLRFMRGLEHHCTVSREMLDFEEDPALVNKAGIRVQGHPSVGDNESILLHLDLSDDELGFAGFVAKKDTDLPPIDPSKEKEYDPNLYWDSVQKIEGEDSVKIEKKRFYIFRSKERFRLPPHLAVDCRAMSESLGDIRIHYAGFAHPFFGTGREPDNGAPLIFEVRCYESNTILHDNTALAKVFFRRMASPALKPERKDVYSKQELKLSKCFKDWT